MQITRNSLETTPGPSDWFTGAVFIDSIAAPEDGASTSPTRSTGAAPPVG